MTIYNPFTGAPLSTKRTIGYSATTLLVGAIAINGVVDLYKEIAGKPRITVEDKTVLDKEFKNMVFLEGEPQGIRLIENDGKISDVEKIVIETDVKVPKEWVPK